MWLQNHTAVDRTRQDTDSGPRGAGGHRAQRHRPSPAIPTGQGGVARPDAGRRFPSPQSLGQRTVRIEPAQCLTAGRGGTAGHSNRLPYQRPWDRRSNASDAMSRVRQQRLDGGWCQKWLTDGPRRGTEQRGVSQSENEGLCLGDVDNGWRLPRVAFQERFELMNSSHSFGIPEDFPADEDQPFPAIARVGVDLGEKACVRFRVAVRFHGCTTSLSPFVVGVKASGAGR